MLVTGPKRKSSLLCEQLHESVSGLNSEKTPTLVSLAGWIQVCQVREERATACAEYLFGIISNSRQLNIHM